MFSKEDKKMMFFKRILDAYLEEETLSISPKTATITILVILIIGGVSLWWLG
jgi:hypothetical protein